MSGWTHSTIEGVAPAVRLAAAGTEWKVRDGALSVIDGGATYHGSIFADWMSFRAKPVRWNEIYWAIMGSTFERAPQATRHWSNLSIHVPIRAQVGVPRGTAERVAAEFVAFAAVEKARTTSLEHVPDVRFAPDRDDDFQMARVVERIASGNLKGAQSLAEDVVAGRVRSSYTHNAVSGSFFELAIAKIGEGFFERSD